MDRQYCPNCVRTVQKAGKCPYCGFDVSACKEDNRSLPLNSRIENYQIGNLLAVNRQAQFYAAVDPGNDRRVIIEEFLPFVTMGRAAGSEEARVAKHADNVEKAKQLFLESDRERCLPLLQTAECNGTVYRIYDAGDGDLNEFAGRLADDPILFRDSDGHPLMSITAMPIPAMPKNREYRGEGAGKEKNSGAGRGIALALCALALIGGTWAGTKALNGLNLLPLMAPKATPEVIIVTVTPVPTATPAPTDVPSLQDVTIPEEALIETEIPAAAETVIPTDTPVPTPTMTPDVTDAPTTVPTETPAPTDTPVPSPDVTGTPAPTDSPTPVPTETPTPAPTPDPTPVLISGIRLQPAGEAVYDGEDWSGRVTVELVAADGTVLESGDAFTVKQDGAAGWTEAGEYSLDAGQIELADGLAFDGDVAAGTITVGRKELKDPYWEPPFSGTIPFFAYDREKLAENITINGETGAYRIHADEADSSLFTWEWSGTLPEDGLFSGEIIISLTDKQNYCFRDGGTSFTLPLQVSFCPDEADAENWALMRRMICRAIETEGLMGKDKFYDPAAREYLEQDSELIVYLYRAYLHADSEDTDTELEIRKWLSEETTRAEFSSYMRYLESRSGMRNDPDGQGMEKIMNLLKEAGRDELMTALLSGALNTEVTAETAYGKDITSLQAYFDGPEESGTAVLSGISREFMLIRLREYGEKTGVRADAIMKQIAPEQETPKSAKAFYQLMQSAAEGVRADLAYLSDAYVFEGKAVLPDGTLTEAFRNILVRAAGDLRIRLQNRNPDSLAGDGIGTLTGEIHKKAETKRAAEHGTAETAQPAEQPSEEPEMITVPEEAEEET